MGVTLKIILDDRREKKNGVYPVKLRVTYDRERRYYPLGQDLSEADFAEVMSLKPRKQFKEFVLTCHSKVGQAKSVLDSMRHFNWEGFESKYLCNEGRTLNVLSYYKTYMEELQREERIGTKESYKQSMESLSTYLSSTGRKPTTVCFSDITNGLLNGYERFMLKKGRSLTTVGIYLRPLRCLYNLAIQDGNAFAELYPFGKRKYQIPGGRKVKKALPKAALNQLYEASGGLTPEQIKARYFWFFSYACNGMNLKDIAELKWNDVQEDRITFIRAKTRLTSKGNQKTVVVFRNDFINQILASYGSTPRSSQSYVFDILKEEFSVVERRAAIKNYTRFVNQHMKKLALKLGVADKVSYNGARHSFTTEAIRNGASIEMIQEMLGHQNVQTTQNYWAGFDDEAKKVVSRNIMNFNSPPKQ